MHALYIKVAEIEGPRVSGIIGRKSPERDEQTALDAATATEAPWKGVDLCNGTVYHWRPARNGRATNPRQGVDAVVQG